MIQIRRNIFEINSSSSHSLVIMTDSIIKENGEDLYFTHDEMLESLHRVSRGIYKPWNDNWYFGRSPFRVLDDFEWKLQYAYANCGEDEDKIKEVTDILKELVPEVKKVSIPENCGVDDWELFSWLEKYNISLKEFLTNKKYVVIQDGDEYCIWKDLINCGLIDKKVIEDMEAQQCITTMNLNI